MVSFILTWFILDIQISFFYNCQNWGVKMEIMSSNFGLRTGYTYGEEEVNTNTGLVTIQGKTERFVSIEQLSASSDKTVQKDVGNTIARGVLGGVLLGPLGAIGGLVLGRNKIEGTNTFIFKVNLTNGKFFIFSSGIGVTSFHSLTPAKLSPIANNNSRLLQIGDNYSDDISSILEQARSRITRVRAYHNHPLLNEYELNEYAYHSLLNKKQHDDNTNEKIVLGYLNDIVLPLYAKNKKSAFTEVRTLHENVYPHFHKIILKGCNHQFFSEYEAIINAAAAKRKFSTKVKNVKKGGSDIKFIGHLYDLAEMYATGLVAVIDNKHSGSKKSTNYPVCEINITYAQELLEQAVREIEVIIDGKSKNELLSKCKALNDFLITPVTNTIVNGIINPSEQPQTSLQISSVADELRKFADLRDSGILTDEEFQTEKKKLLSS